MKITVATIRVPAKPNYKAYENRWLDTYAEFKPKIDHDLAVVDCDVVGPHGRHAEHATEFLVYTGGGCDCGTWQWLPSVIKTDLFVCCNTSVYFWKHGWLDRIVDAVKQHGEGVYGASASYEISPHLRPSFYAFQPGTMEKYPFVCDSREKSFEFECTGGDGSFTAWCSLNGFSTVLVTWNGSFEMKDWSKPENGFRKGDQSDLIVKDRHSDIFDSSNGEEKKRLTTLAYGNS